MSTYVCSDIHGQYSLFQKMLETICFSDEDTLYILGDVIDRGPESVELLKDIMQRKNVRCLLGNHELMMYTHYRPQDSNKKDPWEYPNNGGQKTRKIFESLEKEEQEAILDYIRDMPLQLEIQIGETIFLLSHSDFISDKTDVLWKECTYSDVFNTVWNSPWRFFEYTPLSQYELDKRWHIIGHVPVQAVAKSENGAGERTCCGTKAYINNERHVVNIDMGCALMNQPGRHAAGLALCCLNLEKFANEKTDEAFHYIRPVKVSVTKQETVTAYE